MAKRRGADNTRAGRNQTEREKRVLRELERKRRKQQGSGNGG
jgi:hypothetical protein